MLSPMLDASTAGSLANAALCARDKIDVPEEPLPFAADPRHAPCAALAVPCRTGWRRAADALISLISGPVYERPRNRANNT